MNSNVTPSRVRMAADELNNLTKETKETVATGLKLEEGNRIFGSVDLWNRQRRQRTSLQMRRWLN